MQPSGATNVCELCVVALGSTGAGGEGPVSGVGAGGFPTLLPRSQWASRQGPLLAAS